jgi:hypothetical protein
MDLWIMNTDGSGQQELHHENNKYSDGAYPAWSPDGTSIAFTANNGSGYYHIWSVAASGGQNSELITNKVPGGNPADQEVDWAPAPTNAAPRTKIATMRVTRHPASFSFQATGPATGYRCALRLAGHTATFKPCTSPQSPQIYKRLTRGSYTFSVIGSGPGEPYRAPARRKFRID